MHDVPPQLYFKSKPLRLPLPAVSENLVGVIFFWKPSPLDFLGAFRYSQTAYLPCTIILSSQGSSSNRWPSGRLFRCEFGKSQPTANRHPLTSMSPPKAPKRHLGVIFLFYSSKSLQQDPVILTSNQCPSPGIRCPQVVQVLQNLIAGAS